MIPLFIGLSLVNMLFLAMTAALGYGVFGPVAKLNYHVLCGAMATLICCGVHCVVFTYFIATAKWIQHAILVKSLDPQLATPTRSFKLQAFPAALLAMSSVFLAAIAGAARDNYATPLIWHHALALSALAINVLVALIELRAIQRNGNLVDQILALINAPAAGAV
jgi:hypothetical protein